MTTLLSIFGVGFAAALFGGILWSNARRWRYLSKFYSEPVRHPLEVRNLQSAVLLGLGGFNSLKGILTIGLDKTGISLRVLKPFSLFHAPLYIPHRDINGWNTTWYLDARSTELEFSGAPDVKIIMPAEQAEWIQSYSGQKLSLHNATPPEGKAGRGWHAFSVVHAAIALAMIAWIVLGLFTY